MGIFDDDDEDFVPFNERFDWDDVTPIEQDEGPNPVCVITYSDEFKHVMSYFRAITRKNEFSERALFLTSQAIRLNPGNYTAWHYRRLCLYNLEKDLLEELRAIEQFCQDNPKNYQIWYHRRALVEKSGQYHSELELTEKTLTEDETDNKNYHAWSHRQWVVRAFNLWDLEVDFCDRMINLDFRNNSAWNHRFFVLTNNSSKPFDLALRDQEIDYAFKYIKKAPNNQSSWNYLRGLMRFMLVDKAVFKPSDFPSVFSEVTNISNSFPTCANALALLIDFESEPSTISSLCDKLVSLDPVRTKYWLFRKGSNVSSEASSSSS